MSRRRQAGPDHPREAGSERSGEVGPRPRDGRDGRWRCGRAGNRNGGRDRGSYTAELAVGAVTTRAQCLDAAREAALAASRGEPGARAGSRAAPDGATVSIVVSGDVVTATVTVPVRVLGGRLPRASVSMTAVAAVEPGSPGPSS